MSVSTSEQDRIEQDLERTRSRMDNRLNELQDRLSPGQVLDDLMAYFRGSEGGDFARNLMDSVRNNPLPAALTGIGLTWLMASNPHPAPASPNYSQTKDGNDFTSGYRETTSMRSYSPPGDGWTSKQELDDAMRRAEAGVARSVGESDMDYQGRVTAARGMVLGVAREAEDTADSFMQRVQDAVASATSAAMQSAREFTSDIGDRASEMSRNVGKTLQDAGNQVAQGAQTAQQMSANLLSTVKGNPVLLGAMGLAVGALLGALVPQGEGEEETLAGVAGQARETASDLAQTFVDRGGEVAGRVLEAGSESAQAMGLTADTTIGKLVDGALSGKLVGDVKQVAQDALKAGDEAVRK